MAPRAVPLYLPVQTVRLSQRYGTGVLLTVILSSLLSRPRLCSQIWALS